MTLLLEPETPLIRQDASGALRVGNSRVLLELVVHAFQAGATPEAIVQRYSSLTLPDVYSAIAHYLRHREAIEDYLQSREALAEQNRLRAEQLSGDLTEIRSRLLALRSSPGTQEVNQEPHDTP